MVSVTWLLFVLIKGSCCLKGCWRLVLVPARGGGYDHSLRQQPRSWDHMPKCIVTVTGAAAWLVEKGQEGMFRALLCERLLFSATPQITPLFLGQIHWTVNQCYGAVVLYSPAAWACKASALTDKAGRFTESSHLQQTDELSAAQRNSLWRLRSFKSEFWTCQPSSFYPAHAVFWLCRHQ